VLISSIGAAGALGDDLTNRFAILPNN
jgi:hypothetical protein